MRAGAGSEDHDRRCLERGDQADRAIRARRTVPRVRAARVRAPGRPSAHTGQSVREERGAASRIGPAYRSPEPGGPLVADRSGALQRFRVAVRDSAV